MLQQYTYNTAQYAQFIMRRDRIRIPVWLVALLAVTLAVVPYFDQMTVSGESQAMAETMDNPAVIAMIGPAYGMANYTTGPMMAHQMLLFTGLAVAVMSIMLVIRHTRSDEESGRIEMFRSLPVGRLSNLSATMLVMVGANVILALIFGLGLYAMRIESMDLTGSMLYGATLGAIGIIFAAITALFAQLTETSRGAMGYSFATLGVLYIIRAIGDVSIESLSWLSPLGWILRAEVYVNNYWWPVALTVVAAMAITALAMYLNSIRDLEAGFIAAKPGRTRASAFLQSPLGHAMRLQRGLIIGWAATMFILGASYGSVFGDMEGYFEANELIQQMLPPVEGLSITEQFITMLMVVLSITCTIPAMLMVLKLKSEESKNRTEHLYARAVSRTRLLGSYVGISLVFGALMLFLSAVGMWSAGAGVMDDPIAFSTIFNAAMVYLPAIWVMTGLAILLIGFFPQLTVLPWVFLGYSFFAVYFGGLLQLPQWMVKISPFGHIPQLPVDALNLPALAVLTVIALALTAIGVIGYNTRDIQG